MNSSQFEHNANKLIALKNTIERLKQEEKELKKEIEPFVPTDKPLIFEEGQIYDYSPKKLRSFNRIDVLSYIEEEFGEDVANAVNANCTIKKNVPRRVHVMIWKEPTY
jgi:hypothetical protein